jgi:hypothetical protein
MTCSKASAEVPLGAVAAVMGAFVFALMQYYQALCLRSNFTDNARTPGIPSVYATQLIVLGIWCDVIDLVCGSLLRANEVFLSLISTFLSLSSGRSSSWLGENYSG